MPHEHDVQRLRPRAEVGLRGPASWLLDLLRRDVVRLLRLLHFGRGLHRDSSLHALPAVLTPVDELLRASASVG